MPGMKKKIDKAFTMTPKEFKKKTGTSMKEFEKIFSKSLKAKKPRGK